jgi:hypothetical protein
MTEDLIPRSTRLTNVKNCIECNSTNLRSYIGDLYGSECNHCNDCKTTWGHCNFCEKTVEIDNYTALSKLSKSVDVDAILLKHPECKYDEKTLLVPDNIWATLGLEDSDALSGSWNSYCRECENVLLVSIWFFRGGFEHS